MVVKSDYAAKCIQEDKMPENSYKYSKECNSQEAEKTSIELIKPVHSSRLYGLFNDGQDSLFASGRDDPQNIMYNIHALVSRTFYPS